MDSSKESKQAAEVQASQTEFLTDAAEANVWEHEMTIMQAAKLFPKAVAWSLALSATCVMDGYNFHTTSNAYSQPAFQKAYGTLQANGKYAISAAWQSGLNNISTIGVLVGLYFAGFLSDRYGFRKTLMIAMVSIPPLVFMQFFAPNLAVLIIAQLLMSIPLGVLETTTLAYAAEVAPMCLRPFLTSFVSQMWVVGQTLCTVVYRACLDAEAPWAYRIPYAIQWLWPIPAVVALLFAPESPWWFVRHHRLDEAKKSLARLSSAEAANFNIDKTVALMVLTTEHERIINSSTTWMACFKGPDLRRTILVIALYCSQIIGGSTLRSYATYFFEQAGLADDWSYNMSIIVYMLSLAGTIVLWFVLPYVGRRTLFIWSLAVLTVIYIVMGGLGIPQGASKSSLSWGIAALLVVNGFICYVGVIPIVFILGTEIPSALLRSKTLAIGRIIYSIINTPMSILGTYQVSSTAWNWGAKSSFFWGGLCFLGLVCSYWSIPETKDRTFTEIDQLFEKRVSARRFQETKFEAAGVTLEAEKGTGNSIV
ncbi:MFS transporter, SP family, general alpha glucoside:H+ symporter [Sporothrix schenckii 1099-18]|uniref:MFS transporter, SP family, general alpha glucoside:H+ symporter n=1 Tax=Sporothrix schenckii 1099-18 TaxID=1397361 RepID=A0A0F2MD95_SPOSC|nr:MFS transporter, SP family, general alpha glucoside:H+ symporter [Sporothrix schenckii 1099-18]KJR87617.1 MFS transporter, SP family, general alpha glucoside:H+ symporter [Sporothrix schenckii 1099-18]